MQFRISYQEIQSMVYRKAGKTIVFSYNSEHSIRVGYDVTVLFKTTNMGIDITVERVDNTAVYLSYGGGSPVPICSRPWTTTVSSFTSTRTLSCSRFSTTSPSRTYASTSTTSL